MTGDTLRAGRVRRGGAVLALCGLVALLIGLLYGTVAFVLPTHPEILPDWLSYAPDPGHVPPDLISPAGAISGFVLAFGVLALVLGTDMLVRGTRNIRLTRWLVAMCLVFFAASMILLFFGGETVPRIDL